MNPHQQQETELTDGMLLSTLSVSIDGERESAIPFITSCTSGGR